MVQFGTSTLTVDELTSDGQPISLLGWDEFSRFVESTRDWVIKALALIFGDEPRELCISGERLLSFHEGMRASDQYAQVSLSYKIDPSNLGAARILIGWCVQIYLHVLTHGVMKELEESVVPALYVIRKALKVAYVSPADAQRYRAEMQAYNDLVAASPRRYSNPMYRGRFGNLPSEPCSPDFGLAVDVHPWPFRGPEETIFKFHDTGLCPYVTINDGRGIACVGDAIGHFFLQLPENCPEFFDFGPDNQSPIMIERDGKRYQYRLATGPRYASFYLQPPCGPHSDTPSLRMSKADRGGRRLHYWA